MHSKLTCAAALYLILPSLSFSASLSKESTTLLKTLVELNSSTDHPEGLEKVREVLIPELKNLGFSTSVLLVGQSGNGDHKILVADFPKSQPQVLLVGHIDTVFPKGSSFQKFQQDETKSYGPGVVDMKGGLVLMLDVLKKLKASQFPLDRIRILINDDEEIGSGFSRGHFKGLAGTIHYSLVFEPGLPDGSLVGSHSGVQWLELRVKGKAAHAGLEHEKGLNACVELGHKMTRLAGLTDYNRKLTLNVGTLEGGTKPNVVCEEAHAKLDIRYLKPADLEETLASVRKIASEHRVWNSFWNLWPSAEIVALGDVPAMPVEASAKLLSLVQGLGLPKRVTGAHVGYGSDGGPLAQIEGMNVVVGTGPYGGGMHTDREFMDHAAYAERLELNTKLIQKIISLQ